MHRLGSNLSDIMYVVHVPGVPEHVKEMPRHLLSMFWHPWAVCIVYIFKPVHYSTFQMM